MLQFAPKLEYQLLESERNSQNQLKIGYKYVIIIQPLLLTSAIASYTCEKSLSGVSMPKANEKSIRVSVPYFNRSISKLNPQFIQYASEAILTQNLYSRVLDVHAGGKIQGDMAYDMYWNGEAYEFSIRRFKTSKSTEISAEDVYYSLLRIIAVDNLTHGSLKSLICPGAKINSLYDKCEGLSWSGDKVFLKPTDPRTKSFALSLLGATDYSIIPKGQLDFENPINLNLNLTDTTGLYYVLEDHPEGNSVLALNKNHYLATEKHLGELRLIPEMKDQALERLKNNEVDFLMTISLVSEKELDSVAGKKFRVFKSEPFTLHMLNFPKNSFSKFTPSQRLAIGRVIKELLLSSDILESNLETQQFFPNGSEGYLPENKRNDLNKLISESLPNFDLHEQELTIMTYGKYVDLFKKLFSGYEKINIIPWSTPWTLSLNEQPDLYFVGTDSSFFADIALLSYNFSTKTFGDKEDADGWITDFIKTEDSAVRIKKLEDLHYKFLSEGRVVPICMSSYIAITHLLVKMNFSKLSAWNLFSRVTLESDYE